MNAEHTVLKAHHPARGRHQTLSIVLHWITALLVFAQIALAAVHDHVTDAAMRRDVLAAHRSLGVVIWLLVIARFAWRLLGMQLPPFPANMAKWHQWGARLSEWGLYALMFAQPLTGMAATVLRGRPFDLLGIQVPSLMRPHEAWVTTAQGLHTLGSYGLLSLVLVHAGAAILHRVVADDGVLDSMLPIPRKESGTPIQSVSEG